jgi:hypothetical protein
VIEHLLAVDQHIALHQPRFADVDLYAVAVGLEQRGRVLVDVWAQRFWGTAGCERQEHSQ